MCRQLFIIFSHQTPKQKISELEQLQNEKRKALLEHETSKLRECDEALQRELRDWRSALHPRKQVNFNI